MCDLVAIISPIPAGCGEPGIPINGSLLQFESAQVGAEFTSNHQLHPPLNFRLHTYK